MNYYLHTHTNKVPFLSFLPNTPPHPRHPRRNQQPCTQTQHATPKRPKRRKPSFLQDLPANRRADQHSKRNERKALAEPCSYLIGCVLTKFDDDGGRKGNEGAGEEAVEGHQDDYTRRGVDGDETEAEGRGDESAGDYDIEGAEEVGEDVGDDTCSLR